MKRFAMAGFFTCVLFLTGCGDITGKWTLDCIEPESERQNFDVKCLVLRDDNTFLLKACEDAKPAEVCGTYCYDKDTDTLTFTPEGGPARTYIAEVGLLGFGKMKVCPTGEKAWTAYLKRCKCEPCADKCKPCPAKCKHNPDKCDKPCPKPCYKPAEKKAECPMHRGEPVQKN